MKEPDLQIHITQFCLKINNNYEIMRPLMVVVVILTHHGVTPVTF